MARGLFTDMYFICAGPTERGARARQQRPVLKPFEDFATQSTKRPLAYGKWTGRATQAPATFDVAYRRPRVGNHCRMAISVSGGLVDWKSIPLQRRTGPMQPSSLCLWHSTLPRSRPRELPLRKYATLFNSENM